ncbi:hypothetical protein [Streptomyces zaomyceticus]|uniref:hypothetical protein n=1 Tax=Streptomyces zaomyceticus TaxID=68286 RepID=UPI003793CA44
MGVDGDHAGRVAATHLEASPTFFNIFLWVFKVITLLRTLTRAAQVPAWVTVVYRTATSSTAC